jgi:hypothetical protein
VLYCSSECAAEAETSHTRVCEALKRFQGLKYTLNLSVNMANNLSRIFDFISGFGVERILAYKEGEDSLLGRVLDLISHPSEQTQKMSTMNSLVVGHCFPHLTDQDALAKLTELGLKMLLIDRANSYSLEQTYFHSQQRQLQVRDKKE